VNKAVSRSIIAIAAIFLSAGTAAAQTADWSWHGAISSGGRVKLKGVVGDIVATPSSGREVEVVARMSRHGSAARDVKVIAVETDNGVTICALYPDTNRDQNDDRSCSSRNGGSNHDDDPTRVDFEVRVPHGVEFEGSTVVGDVKATGMTAFTSGASVTGAVNIETTDLARASSVSGSVYVTMGRSDWAGTLSFSSVSGDVTLIVPNSLNADVRASTVSGDIDSDWPMTVRGRIASRSVNATIGSGGRSLNFSTVSGDISLKRRN
jgi:hypothetical protein